MPHAAGESVNKMSARQGRKNGLFPDAHCSQFPYNKPVARMHLQALKKKHVGFTTVASQQIYLGKITVKKSIIGAFFQSLFAQRERLPRTPVYHCLAQAKI